MTTQALPIRRRPMRWQAWLRAKLGRASFEELRRVRWTRIELSAVCLGLVSDVLQVFGPAAVYGVMLGAAGVAGAVLIGIFRPRFRPRCVVLGLVAVLGIGVFGAVKLIQQFVDADDKGVLAEKIEDVAAVQTRILDLLGKTHGVAQRTEAKLDKVAKDFEKTKESLGQLGTIVERLLNDNKELNAVAQQAGVQRGAIMELARRTGANVDDFDQALSELRRAVRIAIEVNRDGKAGSNLGEFVDEVLKRVAALSDKGRFDDAAAEVDRAYAIWSKDEAERQRQEAERRQTELSAGLKILDAGAKQDLLRRDPASAARRIAKAVELKVPDSAKRFDALRAIQEEWFIRGQDQGLNLDLEVSIEIAQILVKAARDSIQRGSALNDLGIALRVRGERDINLGRLEASIRSFRAALDEFNREDTPLDWALSQNNLGNALQTLGEREEGVTRLEEATTAYYEALQEFTRTRVPLNWALTKNNLGNALAILGERHHNIARLEEAIAAYQAALEERTRERVPLSWATTQDNLGSTLSTLGEYEVNPVRLEQAIEAYLAALKERTRERVPLDWALTQNNIGNTLSRLGEFEGNSARLEQAVRAYRAALEEWTRDRAPLNWALTNNNLGNALFLLGRREGRRDLLEQAVDAFRAGLEERTRERAPRAWAMTQNNLGNVLQTLGQHDTMQLKEAIILYNSALEERTRERAPLDWAMTQNNLGSALISLGKNEGSASLLIKSVEVLRAALEERTRERVPLDWAKTSYNLGLALRLLAERTGDDALAEEASKKIAEAEVVLGEMGASAPWATSAPPTAPPAAPGARL